MNSRLRQQTDQDIYTEKMVSQIKFQVSARYVGSGSMETIDNTAILKLRLVLCDVAKEF